MLRVKQGGIKYHFLSFWYDSAGDWTQVSRAKCEHSNPHVKMVSIQYTENVIKYDNHLKNVGIFNERNSVIINLINSFWAIL